MLSVDGLCNQIELLINQRTSPQKCFLCSDNMQNFVYVLALLFTIQCVSAADGVAMGDVLALVMGLGITVIGIFACLGHYARQRGGLDSL